MKKRKNEIPDFTSEDEERSFWADKDSTDYIDWKQGERIRFPQLKPSTRSISIRLPQSLIEDLKVLANKKDVPYQSLLKLYLAERVDEEFGRRDAG
jgi:predicted DNA binding CopG/RHH family protein